jgi:hypothetical protein
MHESTVPVPVVLTTNNMAGFGCAHRSEYFRNIRRVLMSRFNRADAFRNKVVPPMMVKFACEFVTVLGTGEQFQRSFSSCFRYERLGKSRFVRVHACTVTPQTDAATLSIVEIRPLHSEPLHRAF